LPEKLPSVCQKNLEPISISVFQERKPYTKSQLGGHSGEFDEFDEFSVMTLLGASSDQKIMTGQMRKIDHFPMSDVRKTCTICDIRRSSWESVTRGKRWKNRSFFRVTDFRG
jgi:hypothetical protein